MAVFTAFAATTIGTFLTTTVVGNLLLSTGLSLLSQALIGRPKRQEAQFAINTQLRAGGEVPRSIGFGNYITAGSLVYANTWGEDGKTQNAYLTQVIALADIPNVSLTNFIVDGNYVTIGGSQDGDRGFPVDEYNRDDKNHLWIKFFNGTQTSADPLLVNSVSDSDRPYGSDRVGKGVSYAVVTARINQDLFPSIPQFRFQLRGRAYDPRKDSTVGGSGSHRIDDISTWGNGPEADNPVVQIYNILRGVRYEGQWLYGLQRVSFNQLPLSDWFDQMDKAEITVQENAGPVAQYRSGGEIPVEAPIADIIDNILTTCSGRLSEVGGAYKIKVGAPDAPVVSFTDGDVISTSAQVFSPFFGLADLVNGIEASYPDPAQGWNSQAAPPLFNAQAEAEDGNRRLMGQVDMFFSPYPEQVQRLMKQALLDARNSRQHAITLSPAYWPLEAGDVVRWTSERNGYVNKLFRVDAVSDLPSADVVVNLTEVDPSDYDWNTGTEFTPVAEGNLNFNSRPDLPIDPQEWSVQSSDLRDPQNTARRPAIILNWPTTYDDIDSVEFQVRLASNATLVTTGLFGDFASGSGLITDGLLPETNYEVRARLITIDGQRSPFTTWLAVQSGAGYFSNEDFEGGIRQLFEDAGLSAPEIVNALPTTGNFQGRIVFLTTENKLYVWDGTSWGLVAEEIGVIDFSDIEGQIQSAQIANEAVLSQAIADLAVNESKLAANAVTTAKIANTAVSSAKIADLAVNADKIAASAVTTTKIANLAIETGKLANNAVSSAKIADLAVLEGKLAANAVTTAKIANTAVSSAKIADGAATEAKIAASAVTETKISNDAVTAPKIQAGAVVAGKIAAGAVQAGNIAAGSIVAGDIAAGTITGDRIATNTLTAGNIAAGAITANEIATNAVTAIKINAGAVTTAKIAAGAVTAGEIAAGAVTTAKLDALAVTAEKIAAGSIIADKIATNAITAIKINAGAVEADKIATNAVTAIKINANAVTTDKINAGAVVADKIATNAVTAIKINANAVTADKINAGAVTTAKLDALAVTADKVAANAITADKIAANTITANEIAANTITGGLLATSGIITNSAQIENGLITNAKIANLAVDTAKIANGAITTAKIGDAQITTAKIGNAEITNAKIDDLAVNTIKIADQSVSVVRTSTNSSPPNLLGGATNKNGTGWQTFASLTFTPVNARELTAYSYSPMRFTIPSGSDESDDTYRLEIRYRWRGSTIRSAVLAVFSGQLSVDPTPIATVSNPGTTSGTFEVQFQMVRLTNNSASGTASQTYEPSELVLWETKK
jgi:hypothetical protein